MREGLGVVADVAKDIGIGGKTLPAAVEAHSCGRMDKGGDYCFTVGKAAEKGQVPQEIQRREHGTEVLGLDLGLKVHSLEDFLAPMP